MPKKTDKRGAKPGEYSNKPYVATEENKKLVKTLTAFGITQEKIATQLEISVDTLQRHYRRELDLGRVEAVSKMAQGV